MAPGFFTNFSSIRSFPSLFFRTNLVSHRSLSQLLESSSSLTSLPPKKVAVYQPITTQSFIYDFLTHKPEYLAQLPHSIYGAPIRKDLIHRCVCWQRNAMRQGTHATKNRSQVRGSTRKLRGQKKSGRARVGSIRSPIFRKGGIAHGPVPRSHFTELQGKVREQGLRSVLSSKFRSHQLVFTTPIELKSHKTRDLLTIINQHYPPLTREGLKLALTKKGRNYSSLLIVSGAHVPNPHLFVASQNLPNVKVLAGPAINVYDILKHEYLVIDNEARTWLEWRLATDL
ncbi:54S ribosomal protein L4 mitochondrial [Coelomomyces lativittatus]|nr:54S ribosomal protein L4 mitochondrial [Coelomomyces lativittatus]KAJ1508833.1 54S ribosomal protein L4 mitochondrial [Coelomomyces lativittatus]KAJ1512433.1 54S ribosomal protein L4 mitochondrial [Coelomomyces lativittatus]